MCNMTDLLFSCANNFQKLFNVSYDLCLGRKGKLHNIHLTFAQDQFFHLSGLHKLDDLPWLKRVKRERIFEDILCGHLTIETLAKSLHYSDIENRLKYLNCLESFLDSDRLVYRYDPRFHNHSKIQANYLLQNELFSDTVFVFLKKDGNTNDYICNSIFRKGYDFSSNSQRLTLLSLRKLERNTGEILYCYERK